MKRFLIVLIMLIGGYVFAEPVIIQGDLLPYHSLENQTIYFVSNSDNVNGTLLKENKWLLKEGFINIGQQEPITEEIEKDTELMYLLNNYNFVLVYVEDKAVVLTKENDEITMNLYLTQTAYYKIVEEMIKDE